MNILYLHGLESKLSPEKRAILEQYGKVLAPDLDYHNNPSTIESILKDHSEEKIDAVVGSSMGGFAGYYLSSLLNIPALLFNPALYARTVEQRIPPLLGRVKHFKRIIIGLEDEVVNPIRSVVFLGENLEVEVDLDIRVRTGMAHRVPVDVFEQELEDFFRVVNS